MPLRYYSAFILVFTLLHCSGPATAVPLADLDYVEIADQTGWVLRVHGDGGGSLSHKQLPAYHLHYPAATFRAAPGRQIARRCRGKRETPVCFSLDFYDALSDEVVRCNCTPGTWPATIMAEAIARMQYAVEAGGSEESCRMLRRRWLASN